MIYPGIWYAIPSILAFGVFLAWCLVCSRMANLGLPRKYRVGVMLWTFASLYLAVMDLSISHYFDSETDAVREVAALTVRHIGSIAVAVAVYILIGRHYIHRMAMCEKEPGVTYSRSGA